MTSGRTPVFASLAMALGVALVPACTSPEGEGSLYGALDSPPCLTGPFDLAPDFFGTIAYRSQVMFRIQQSSDNQAYSDGAVMVVEDIEKVKSSLDRPLVVTLPPEVTAPGVPITPTDDPGNVHLSLYLLRTCKTQPATLHAVREVSFDGVGAACDVTRPEGATIDPACEAPPFSTDPRGDGKSRIVFHSIFAGDTATLDSEPRRTRGCFDLYLADPREVNGATLAPPRCRGHLRGTFDFLFRRSRPSQPFP